MVTRLPAGTTVASVICSQW